MLSVQQYIYLLHHVFHVYIESSIRHNTTGPTALKLALLKDLFTIEGALNQFRTRELETKMQMMSTFSHVKMLEW